MTRSLRALTIALGMTSVGLVSWVEAGPTCPPKEILFLMDGSGSISAADFAIEKDGLQAAISNPNLVPLNGTIALGLVQFGNGSTTVELPLTTIASATERDAVLAAIAAIVQLGGSTNPGDAINTAAAEFATSVCDPAGGSQQLCLITDGLPNDGADTATALATAQASSWGLDGFGVLAIEDPGAFSAADAEAFYGPLVFGGGGVTVVANAVEFANFAGPTCFGDALRLVGFEVNQAIQDWNNTVQLIDGKRTWVRCHLEPADPMVTQTVAQARLRGYRDGVELPLSPLTAINPGGQVIARQNAVDRRDILTASLNFILPTSWASGDLVLELEAVGAGIDCSPAAAMDDDCTTSVPLTFAPSDRPEIRWVRVSWTDLAGCTFTPTVLQSWELRNRFNAIFPIRTHVRTTDTHTYGGELDDEDDLPILSDLNSELRTKRFFDLCWGGIFGCDEIYYGILWNANVGGLAISIDSSVSSGEMPAADFTYGRNRHAHEIGHNLGRRHATFCGAESSVATAFPYTAMIGGEERATLGPMDLTDDDFIFGMDTYARRVVDPNDNYELMSYCIPGRYRWISKHTYDAVKTAIDDTFPAGGATGPAGPYAIYSGRIDLATDTAILQPTIIIDAPAGPPLPDLGTYSLRTFDATDTMVASVDFAIDAQEADLACSCDACRATRDQGAGGAGGVDPSTAHFIVPVPYDPSVVRVTVVHGGFDIAERLASAHAPTISIIFPAGGETLATDDLTFTWDSADDDADALVHLVQYSPDDGVSWQTLAVATPAESITVPRAELTAGTSARLRVYASDGFHSAEATSAPFTVANNPPGVSILAPRQGSFYTAVQTLYLRCVAEDREEGELPGTSSSWSSDVDGFLGIGDDLELSAAVLSDGVHNITCTATDATGATATDSVAIVKATIFEFMDCNANEVSDLIDVADGTSPDCNVNFIPDECDIAAGFSGDCNGNGVPDECDIASGLETDCNSNGVPDSCDISTGASGDCNGNGVPDECDIAIGLEVDCNGNGIPDSWDLSSGSSFDCNLNGTPDECDIAAGSETDCNLDGVPDACELASGFAKDCNSNGIIDECDIASGFSSDTNGDGIPDECALFIRGDANVDGMLGLDDAISILEYLAGTDPTICLDADDVDDDGEVNIVDPIFLLSYLFTSGAMPPSPSFCGQDPSLDDLDCFGPVTSCP
ncbi:MAG: VWA domain-containing protein [Planctomycetes bacterium]|nr:VWA domain-containing protein [Planctomycetota bacterium]